MNVVQRLRGKQEAKEMIERKPLAPAVQQHIESIEQMYNQLENAERTIDQYKSAVNQANVEIRAQRLEIDTLRDMFDNEVRVRQHYELLAADLSVSLANVQDQIATIFRRVDTRKAEALKEQEKNLPPEKKEEEPEVPKFLLKQDKFTDELDGKSG